MDETDEELKSNNKGEETIAIGIAMAATNPNDSVASAAVNITTSHKVREEGELSSSDNDDELPTGSASQFTGGTAAQSEPIRVTAVDNNTQAVKEGKSFLTNKPASFSDGPSVQPNHGKSFEKNRVPFVISFSDDDSGSDSEDGRQRKALETEGNTLGAEASRRPPASSLTKSQALVASRNQTKVFPRKESLSGTFVSSMPRITGGNSRNGFEQRSRGRNFNSLNKKFPSQEQGCKKNLHVNSSKLQDLRQQIIIRENELKLKSAKKNKERNSSSYRNYDATNLSNEEARTYRATSAGDSQCEPKEPIKKRLKVSEPCSSQLTSNDWQGLPAAQSMFASEKSVMKNCGLHSIDDHRRRGKDIFLGSSHSTITRLQKQDDHQGHVSSENLRIGLKESEKGTGIIESSQWNRNTKSTVELKHPSEHNCQDTPCSVQIKATPGTNLSKGSDFHEIICGEKALKTKSDDTYQSCSFHLPDNNLDTSNNASMWNCFGKMNLSGNSNMDIQSMLDMEEMQDKELEEAQEHRRKCEVEEINALKAYRKAQRALLEADARCSYLYRRRELCSAQFRSRMMDDSSLFLTLRQQNYDGGGLNYSNNMPEVNMHVVPTPRHQMQAEFDAYDQHRHDLNAQSNTGALENLSNQYVDGQNNAPDPCSKPEESMAPDPCSEPDASTSDPLKDNGVAKVVCSSSDDLGTSSDDDGEILSFEHRSDQFNLESQKEEEINEERVQETNDRSTRSFSINSCPDSLRLEASLRSQLVAKLGKKTLSKNRGPSRSMEPSVERGPENNDGRGKTEMNLGNISCSEAKKAQGSDLEGHQSTRPVTFSCPILRSAFDHMLATHFISRRQEIHALDLCNKNGNCVGCNEYEPRTLNSNSTKDTLTTISVGEIGSYTCNLAIDPFWPLCMYELRGKCNNDECCWQHVRDYSCRNMNNDISENSGFQVGPSLHKGQFSGATNLSKCLDCCVLAPPSYPVCLDPLKADFHSNQYVIVQSVGQCWKKCFSASLVLSSLLPSDEPFLHGTEARIEIHDAWNRRPLYFHCRNDTLSKLDHQVVDEESSLEMALLNLNQEGNKQKGRIEALKVLAGALEAEPRSVVLWIVYLQIYYCDQKSVGKDDMFHCAVEHNDASYELWLMYVNSRTQLDNRLIAYDTALSALCRNSSASDKDAMHTSECIFDLFLQMMNCLCISGKTGKAFEKIYRLVPSGKKSDEPCSLFLSDILTSLTIYDKCIFWICCVYFVVYEKVPDALVQQFECRKEVSALDWPFACLTDDRKQLAVRLMEMAVDSLALYIDHESLQIEDTLRAAHGFAVNHIRCVAVLEGLECSRNLLEKYTKLYPSCLELVLMSARAREDDSSDLIFLGFEEALTNWHEEVPGIQCIWNQYAEYALQNERFDFAKELMNRWYHFVWKVQCSESGILDAMDTENSNVSQASASARDHDAWISFSSKIDILFGLLNLSLHRLLQNDHFEARLALDRALKEAAAEDYRHCVREHAIFMLRDGSQFKKDDPIRKMMKILNSYLVDDQAFHAAYPLSRKFIQSIKKPRVQLLVSSLLSPVSSDFSLMNLVLEVWHGPSLFPPLFNKLTDLVDFVESILEMVPSNYQLAISVCKLVSGVSNNGKVSANVAFWASSLLVNALFQAVPVAPEFVWVEAANILHNLADIQPISESFHRKALVVYPFSIKLWKSYLNLSMTTGNENSVIEKARKRGIKLD